MIIGGVSKESKGHSPEAEAHYQSAIQKIQNLKEKTGKMITANGDVVDIKWWIEYDRYDYGREYLWYVSSDARGKESGKCPTYDAAVGEVTKRVMAASLGIPPTMESKELVSSEAGK